MNLHSYPTFASWMAQLSVPMLDAPPVSLAPRPLGWLALGLLWGGVIPSAFVLGLALAALCQ